MPDAPAISEGGFAQVGGDFARVFDHEDYLSMANALDEATVFLRAHLILEEFLNIWCSRITATEDLFSGTFVPFKTKLVIARNLGLAADFADVFDKFNEVRNRYSHRRKYAVEASTLESLTTKVNSLPSAPPLRPCQEFEIYLDGVDQQGERKQITHQWEAADAKKRLLIVSIQLVLKLVQWMQAAFTERGIKYQLYVASPAGESNAT